MKLENELKIKKDLELNIIQLVGFVKGFNQTASEKITTDEVIEYLEKIIEREV